MPEGFDPSDAPVRRGRRDPELLHQLEADNQLGDPDAGDMSDQSFIGLAPGDIVMAKVTHAVTRNDGGDSWFSYGVQSRVLDHETEEAAYMRVATVCNQRVLDLADDAEQRIDEIIHANTERARVQRGH